MQSFKLIIRGVKILTICDALEESDAFEYLYNYDVENDTILIKEKEDANRNPLQLQTL